MFDKLQITGLIDVLKINVADHSLYVQNICGQKNGPLENSLRNSHTYLKHLETLLPRSLTAQIKRTPQSLITVSAPVRKCRLFSEVLVGRASIDDPA